MHVQDISPTAEAVALDYWCRRFSTLSEQERAAFAPQLVVVAAPRIVPVPCALAR